MVTEKLLAKAAAYTDVSLSFIDNDGYPFSVPVHVAVDHENLLLKIAKPAALPSLENKEISLTFNHITPLPVEGYTDRRYIVLWGKLTDAGDAYNLKPVKGYEWDEKEIPFFQYSEMKVNRARSYLDALQEKPWVSTPWPWSCEPSDSPSSSQPYFQFCLAPQLLIVQDTLIGCYLP